MEADDDLMAFLTAKLDGPEKSVASDSLPILKRANPLTTPYVDTSSRNYDDDLAAFLDLKETTYAPPSKTSTKPVKPSVESTIDDLLRIMSQATFGSAFSGSKRINSPAATHDEQKMQLTADLRMGKSSISFPVLPMGLRMNAY
jgi:hypothetical protein